MKEDPTGARRYYRRCMGLFRKVVLDKKRFTWGERWAMTVLLKQEFDFMHEQDGLPIPKLMRGWDAKHPYCVDPPERRQTTKP